MALYHLSVKYISRKQGRSSVSAAAYRSAENLYCTYDGQQHDFTRKTGVLYTEVLIPDYAPLEFHKRESLWNAVEQAEKRKDSRTAREIEVALPIELTLDEQIALVREYITTNFISLGICADIAIHQKDIRNPHAHILLTTRPVGRKGFHCRKAREWDKRDNVTHWRKQWAEMQNRALERKGLHIRVNHESYRIRGIDKEPTKHLGYTRTALERYGIETERGKENRAIMARNQARELERLRIRERSYERSR